MPVGVSHNIGPHFDGAGGKCSFRRDQKEALKATSPFYYYAWAAAFSQVFVDIF